MQLPFSSVNLVYTTGKTAILGFLSDCSTEQQEKFAPNCLSDNSFVLMVDQVIVAAIVVNTIENSQEFILNRYENILQIETLFIEPAFEKEQLLTLLLMASITVWEQSGYQYVIHKIQDSNILSSLYNTGFSFMKQNHDQWLVRGLGQTYIPRTLLIVQNAIDDIEDIWESITSSIVRQIQMVLDNNDSIIVCSNDKKLLSQKINQALDEVKAMNCNNITVHNIQSLPDISTKQTMILTGFFQDIDELLMSVQHCIKNGCYVLIPVHAIGLLVPSENWKEMVDRIDNVELIQNDFCLDV